jgi:hypothetical protein
MWLTELAAMHRMRNVITRPSAVATPRTMRRTSSLDAPQEHPRLALAS